jgi:hypothetical protein
MIWVVPFIAILIACIAQPALAVSVGSLVAWGINDDGQCDVPEGNNFTAISADGRDFGNWSWQHSIALKSNGSLVAWGCDDCNVPADNNFTAIATGFYHTLALKSDGSLAAWGVNDDGQCDIPAGNDFNAIAAGAYHSLALKSDGSLVAWGYNGNGRCNVPAGNDFNAIAAGAYHSLALKSNGSLVAWGVNDDNQCDVPEGNSFIAIAAGDMHSLALKSDGSLVAWGVKGGVYDFNQCDVPTGNEFTAISAGGYHNLALKSDGSLVAWGANYYGQCNVPAGNNFTAIAAGGYHNLAVVAVVPVVPSYVNLTAKFGVFDGKKKAIKLPLRDCSGTNIVSFSLTGGGYGKIDPCDCSFGRIELYGTTDKSILTISSKNQTSVGSIICQGPLKGINAAKIDISGSIEIGSSSNLKAGVIITFDETSNLTLHSLIPIKTLSATEWLGGSIDAPSVGSITTKGDMKKRGIPGDLDVNVTLDGSINTVKVAGTLSGEWVCNAIKSISATDIVEANLILSQQPNTKILALGKLTAKGWIDSSQIVSQGNIGTVTAGAMINSACFTGVADGITGLPAAEIASFPVTATIKSITIKGIKGEPNSVINSNIAAANILSASLAYPQNLNGGMPFGITADYIKKLTIKNATGSKSYKELKESKDSSDFDDAEIRLY